MHRFYITQPKINQERIILTDKQEIYHIKNVLRSKINDTIQIFNNNKQEITGNILSLTKNEIIIKRISFKLARQSSTKLILACAMPKKSKFETIIEKATEFGIDEIIPMETKRTEIKLKNDQIAKKKSRFQKIAINAAKQSKRISIPTILPIRKFSDILECLTNTSTVVMPSLTKETKPLLEVLTNLKKDKAPAISFLIGPEGDFTDAEYALAHKKKAIPVSLGPTVLRVETAAFCVSSSANLLFH